MKKNFTHLLISLLNDEWKRIRLVFLRPRLKLIIPGLLMILYTPVLSQYSINSGGWYTDGYVSSVVEDETFIYLGGSFSNLTNGTDVLEISNLARLYKSNHQPDESWNPQVDGNVDALAINDTALYVGGQFYHVGTDSTSRIANVDIRTAQIYESWNGVHADAAVKDLAIYGGYVFVAGQFRNISGEEHGTLAKLNLNDGSPVSEWDVQISKPSAYSPLPGGIIWSMTISGSNLYVGGIFNTISAPNTTSTASENLAKFNADDGSLDATWTPFPNKVVRDLMVVDTALFLVGQFTTVNGTARNRIAKIDALGTGMIDTEWDADADPGVRNGTLYALEYLNGKVYVGGGFSNIGGENIGKLARLDPSGTGRADATWTPGPNGSVNSLLISGDDVFLAGNFTSANGVAAGRFAKVTGEIPVLKLYGNDVQITAGDISPDFADSTRYDTIQIGSSEANTFTIMNTGSADLTINDISVSGSTAFEVQALSLPLVLAPFESIHFDVSYNPVALELVTATVSISSDDWEKPNFDFNIDAIGKPIPPEINMSGLGHEITGTGSNTPSSIDGTDFGTVVIGDSAAHTFGIINTGGSDLVVSNINTAGLHSSQYSIHDFSGQNVAAEDTLWIEVFYKPSTKGNSSAQIIITNSDSDEGSFIFNISGMAITPATIFVTGKALTIDGSGNNIPSLNDGTTVGECILGDSIISEFKVINTGEETLSISDIQLGGSQADQFGLWGLGENTEIPSLDTVFVIVSFKPDVLGEAEAVITISSNDDATEIFAFNIRATGVETPLNNHTDMNQLVFYPNPVANFIFLKTKKPGHISIFSLSGQLVKNLEIEGALVNKIDLTQLTPGTYLLEIRLPDHTKTTKIIKE